MKQFKRLADDIAGQLVARGITVHRYDAVKTDSVYLKLDYGAINSIRIGGHPGYEHAKHRYNIGTWVSEPIEVDDGLLRYFWPVEDAPDLIARVTADKRARIEWVGESGYSRIVEKKRNEARRAKNGFWTHARKVKRRKRYEQ